MKNLSIAICFAILISIVTIGCGAGGGGGNTTVNIPQPGPVATDTDGDGIYDPPYGTDCAPLDGDRWLTVTEYPDADGDGLPECADANNDGICDTGTGQPYCVGAPETYPQHMTQTDHPIDPCPGKVVNDCNVVPAYHTVVVCYGDTLGGYTNVAYSDPATNPPMWVNIRDNEVGANNCSTFAIPIGPTWGLEDCNSAKSGDPGYDDGWCNTDRWPSSITVDGTFVQHYTEANYIDGYVNGDLVGYGYPFCLVQEGCPTWIWTPPLPPPDDGNTIDVNIRLDSDFDGVPNACPLVPDPAHPCTPDNCALKYNPLQTITTGTGVPGVGDACKDFDDDNDYWVHYVVNGIVIYDADAFPLDPTRH
jgi:hypothetical protein